MKNLILMFACLFITSVHAQSQSRSEYKKDDYLIVEILDGSKYKGNFISENKTHIELDVIGLGNTPIEKRFIKEVKLIDASKIVEGKYYYDSPIYSKYYLSESAIGLKKGEGFYQNLQVFGNIFAYGITDNFTLSGGIETLSLFVGEVPGFYISPKFTFGGDNSNVHFGFGANFATYQLDNLFGSTYGMVTLGNKNNNLTAGVGFGFYADDSDADISGTPVFNLSGMTRISQKFGLVADFFIVEDFILGTITIRYMTENVAFDLGAVVADGGSAPVLGITIKL